MAPGLERRRWLRVTRTRPRGRGSGNRDQLRSGSSLLQNALASLNVGDISTACSQLGAYINQVQVNAASAALGC